MSIGQSMVAVTGLGMTSSMGGVVTACAAARAGMQRAGPLAEVQVHDLDLFESVPIQGHPVRGVTEGYQGMGRLLRLADEALLDLLTHARLKQEDLQSTGLFLNLSSDFFRRAVEARDGEAAARLRIKRSGPLESELRRQELREYCSPSCVPSRKSRSIPGTSDCTSRVRPGWSERSRTRSRFSVSAG